jgi:hypothetical protein
VVVTNGVAVALLALCGSYKGRQQPPGQVQTARNRPGQNQPGTHELGKRVATLSAAHTIRLTSGRHDKAAKASECTRAGARQHLTAKRVLF